MKDRSRETSLENDPKLEGGEWLFRRAGQVFGPVDSRGIAAMLYRGEIDGTTPLSPGDGTWRKLSEIPIFLVHAKKAEAGLRVEREVTGERKLRERRRRRKIAVAVAGVVLLVAGAVLGVLKFMPDQSKTSALLEDFGAGIRIASAARVGVSRREARDDLVEVTLAGPELDRGGPRRAAKRPGTAAAAGSSGAVEGGDLVLAQFDEKKIHAVVAREQKTLAPCFRAEASRSPDFEGDVPIEFAIGNDGRVAQLWIDEPRFKHGALRDCLAAALGGWRFDAFPGQRPTVSLAFRIGR
ncbi:MAG TPA: AgmX/PglI C-terminal domain-containing protein [Anaeromyxobacter sp.]|nr:AgmX/PglI C-terminal domain-containing protein [Anaeromyxobacter sp.]